MDEKEAASLSNAVFSAYYNRFISRGDALRDRARGAYATLSTLAGGLIGIGLLTQTSQLSFLTRALGSLATAGWAVATISFVVTAASSVNLQKEARTLTATSSGSAIVLGMSGLDENTGAGKLLRNASLEQRRLKQRLRFALGLGAFAMMLTIVTVITAVIGYPANSASDARLQVHPTGAELFAQQCGTPVRSIEHVVEVSGLTATTTFLEVTLSEGVGKGCRVLIPRTSVAGVQLD